MLTNCLLEIAGLLDNNIDEMDLGQPLFTDSRYKAYPFDKANFNVFDKLGSTEGKRRKVAFIDGGNLEVLRAPNFSVQLVRVYYNIMQDNKRIIPHKVPIRIDFFVTAFARFMDGNIYYSGILVPLIKDHLEYLPSGEHLMIDSMDKKISTGGFRADISVVGSMTRRFAEWLVASHVIKEELSDGDVLVRDGTLQTAVANEKVYADQAFEAAKEKGVVLSGVAKTSTLFTTTGLSLLAAVHKMSSDTGLDKECWYYNPIADNDHPDHPAEMYVAKLDPSSNYVFRCEIFKPQATELGPEGVEDIFVHLAKNSSDLSFLGYPYGLVDADQYARVPRSENEIIKGLIGSTMSKLDCYDKLSRHLYAVNAHDVLDRI